MNYSSGRSRKTGDSKRPTRFSELELLPDKKRKTPSAQQNSSQKLPFPLPAPPSSSSSLVLTSSFPTQEAPFLPWDQETNLCSMCNASVKNGILRQCYDEGCQERACPRCAPDFLWHCGNRFALPCSTSTSNFPIADSITSSDNSRHSFLGPSASLLSFEVTEEIDQGQ